MPRTARPANQTDKRKAPTHRQMLKLSYALIDLEGAKSAANTLTGWVSSTASTYERALYARCATFCARAVDRGL